MEARIRTGETVTLVPKREGIATANPWVVCAVSESLLFDERKGTWVGLELKSDRGNIKWVLLDGDENYILQRKGK